MEGVGDTVRVMGGHVHSTAVQGGSIDTEWSEMETVGCPTVRAHGSIFYFARRVRKLALYSTYSIGRK